MEKKPSPESSVESLEILNLDDLSIASSNSSKSSSDGEPMVTLARWSVYQEEDKKDPPLNKPKKGGPKKFYVFVKDGDKIKKVTWGDTTGLKVKLNDKDARKSFAARHKCAQQKDRTSAAYWACNLPRYAKSLGLSGGGNFYW